MLGSCSTRCGYGIFSAWGNVWKKKERLLVWSGRRVLDKLLRWIGVDIRSLYMVET